MIVNLISAGAQHFVGTTRVADVRINYFRLWEGERSRDRIVYIPNHGYKQRKRQCILPKMMWN